MRKASLTVARVMRPPKDVRNKQGKDMDKCYLYRLLNNRAFLGEAVHNGEAFKGEHEAIIDAATWEKVHVILREPPRPDARAAKRADLWSRLPGPVPVPNSQGR
jgi:hypothetical protein